MLRGEKAVPIAILTILILIIVALIVYNITIQSKIKKFQNTNQRIKNLAIVQDFMNTIGEESSVDAKIKKINDLILEKYQIQYSTIVVFDGAEYVVKASNVEEKHWNSLRSLQEDENFIDSIQSASPIDSYVKPMPWNMPGYDDKVVMAAGAFTQGSSIELSCDGPIREPFIAYQQGSLTYNYGKIAVMKAVSELLKNEK